MLIVLFYYACLFGAYYILAGRQQTLATAGARGGASRAVKTFGSARRTMAATVTRANGTAVLGSTDASKTTLLPTDLYKTPTLSSRGSSTHSGATAVTNQTPSAEWINVLVGF